MSIKHLLTALALLLALFVCSRPAISSEKATGTIGGGLEFGLPVGSLNETSESGLGIIGYASYVLTENIYIAGKSGFMIFNGKPRDAHSDSLGDYSDTYLIPFAVGPMFRSARGSYEIFAGLDIGVCLIADNKTAFSYYVSPYAGIILPFSKEAAFDFQFNFTAAAGVNYFGIRLGLSLFLFD